VSDMTQRDDDFVRGWLLCLSTLVGGFGTSAEAEHLFREIGSPSDTEVRRMNLCEYDRRNLNLVRKVSRRGAVHNVEKAVRRVAKAYGYSVKEVRELMRLRGVIYGQVILASGSQSQADRREREK